VGEEETVALSLIPRDIGGGEPALFQSADCDWLLQCKGLLLSVWSKCGGLFHARAEVKVIEDAQRIDGIRGRCSLVLDHDEVVAIIGLA